MGNSCHTLLGCRGKHNVSPCGSPNYNKGNTLRNNFCADGGSWHDQDALPALSQANETPSIERNSAVTPLRKGKEQMPGCVGTPSPSVGFLFSLCCLCWQYVMAACWLKNKRSNFSHDE